MTVKLATVDGLPIERRGCRLVDLTPELLALAISLHPDATLRATADLQTQGRAIVPGFSFAAIDGGTLIAAMGLLPVWYGRALGWAFPTPLATRRHLVFMTREMRAHIETWQKDPRFRRIEMAVRADEPWRESFARALGMTEAFGPLEKFDTEGRDYWIYARVVSWPRPR